MAIEAKQILDYLDIEATDDTTFDEVKSKIDETFVKADPLAIKSNEKLWASLLGNINGAFIKRLRKAGENLGFEITKEEIDSNDTVDLIDIFGERAQQKIGEYPTKIEQLTTELDEAKKKGASAKDLDKLQGELTKWETKYNDLEGLHKSTAEEFDKYKSTVADEKKNFVISRHKQDALGQVKLNTKSEFEKKGFLQEVENKYQLDLDGEDAIVRDKEGKRIPNPEKAGSFMSYSEILKKEAAEAGLLEDNPHRDKPVQKPNTRVINDSPTNDNEIIRPVRKSSLLQ